MDKALISKTIFEEWYFWLYSIVTGAGMAFAYDWLRLCRKLFKHKRALVDLEDLLYWTACFLASFVLLYYGNNGVIRIAAVLGAAIGMAVYELTFGRFLVKYVYILIDGTIGRFIRCIRKCVLFVKYRLTRALFHYKMSLNRKLNAIAEKRKNNKNNRKNKNKKPNKKSNNSKNENSYKNINNNKRKNHGNKITKKKED